MIRKNLRVLKAKVRKRYTRARYGNPPGCDHCNAVANWAIGPRPGGPEYICIGCQMRRRPKGVEYARDLDPRIDYGRDQR